MVRSRCERAPCIWSTRRSEFRASAAAIARRRSRRLDQEHSSDAGSQDTHARRIAPKAMYRMHDETVRAHGRADFAVAALALPSNLQEITVADSVGDFVVRAAARLGCAAHLRLPRRRHQWRARRVAAGQGQDRVHPGAARGDGGLHGVAPTPSSPARLGVCLSTGGPGATHLITGLYDAKLRPRAGAGHRRPGAAHRARRATTSRS